MRVLADSSVWIDFFRRKNKSNRLTDLLAEDLVVTNRLILAEILPALKLKAKSDIIGLLRVLMTYEIEPDWEKVIQIQLGHVQRYRTFVGIPDIMIFQNAQQHGLVIYSFDQDVLNLCEMNNVKYFN